MRCERTRERLADYLDGRLGAFGRRRVRRHVERCAACAAALRDEESLNEVLGAWEDEAPPEGVWLRIRDSLPASLPSDAPPVPWWVRVRETCVRHAVPYVLGAATTALVVLALGAGRTTPTQPPSTPHDVGRPADGAPVVPWGEPAAAAPREGEVPLVIEDPGTGLVYRRSPEFRRWIEILRERNALPPDWQERTMRPAARPAAHTDEDH